MKSENGSKIREISLKGEGGVIYAKNPKKIMIKFYAAVVVVD